MKKNKGFTLIELLAIIVILAIIAVITVPIILNIIENSRMGAATDSAYGYKDAINKWYVTKLSTDPDYSIPEETYTISELENLGVSYSGQEPGENSWVSIEKNNVINGCLQFDEYKVEISSGKVGDAVKEECEAPTNAPQYLYISKRIYIYPNMDLATYDEDEYDYIKTGDKLQLSDGTTTRPTNKNSYLKYALTNGEVAEGTVPEACIYSDTYGGELCLKNNEYETSKQKIFDYFGYTTTGEDAWTNTSGSTWKNSTQTIICNINAHGVDCGDSAVNANVRSTSNVGANDYSAGFYCYVNVDGSAFCEY